MPRADPRASAEECDDCGDRSEEAPDARRRTCIAAIERDRRQHRINRRGAIARKRVKPACPTSASRSSISSPQSDQPAGKREIARAFGLSGHDKIALKALLKDMADEGLIDSAPGRAFHKAGGVPKVTVLRVVDGRRRRQVWAVPEQLAGRHAARRGCA